MMIKQGLPLSRQEVLYAELEGKHGALDDEKDRGGFYIHSMRNFAHNKKALVAFIKAYNEHIPEES